LRKDIRQEIKQEYGIKDKKWYKFLCVPHRIQCLSVKSFPNQVKPSISEFQ
jgi:hypothetical protein